MNIKPRADGQKRDTQKRYPPARPLTPQEQEMVLANKGLAHAEAWRIARFLAARHGNRGYLLQEQYHDELIDAAYIGLCLAVERFDPNLGFQLSSYACHLIRSHVGIAATVANLTVGKIRLGMKTKAKSIASASTVRINSADASYALSQEEMAVWDPQEEYDPGDVTPELTLLISLILDERQQRILDGYVFQEKTLQALGEEEGVSKERIRQILERSLRNLRESDGFMTALVQQMKRRREHMNRDDFFGTGTATKIA